MGVRGDLESLAAQCKVFSILGVLHVVGVRSVNAKRMRVLISMSTES